MRRGERRAILLAFLTQLDQIEVAFTGDGVIDRRVRGDVGAVKKRVRKLMRTLNVRPHEEVDHARE